MLVTPGSLRGTQQTRLSLVREASLRIHPHIGLDSASEEEVRTCLFLES